MLLVDKAALITGAGRGIGRAIALTFAREGAAVALVSRTTSQLEETAAQVCALGGRALPITADVTDPAQVKRMVEQTIGALGRIDLLVNNAGDFLVKPMADTTLEEFNHTLSVNLCSVFLCCQAVLPHMRRQGGGVILNMSSLAGKRPYLEQGAYCAAKHGVVGLTRVLAAEWKAFGIRVCALCPGGVDTELVAQARPELDRSEYMDPQDVAQVALFLASLPPRAAIDEVDVRRWASWPMGL